MKYWLITTNTRDGDHEYEDLFLAKALNEEGATKEVKEYYSDQTLTPDDPDSFRWQGNELDRYDTIVEIENIKEVPEAHFEVLRKYIYVL